MKRTFRSPARYGSNGVFNGTIHRVIVDIGNDQKPMPKTPERD